MKPILIVAPHRKIEYTARKVADYYEDVDVKLALLHQAVKMVKSAEEQGVEAIISRGGTARIIEKAVPSVPVIEMEVSPYDLLNAVSSAKKYGNNIFIVGFRNIIQDADLLGSIIDANINVHLIDNESDGEIYLKNLISSGERIDVLLGGTVAESLALKYNIPTVLLETGSAAIDSSIKEARRIIEVARREKEETEQFKAILRYINEGVIAIDSNENITVINPAAGKMFGLSEKQAIGKPIEEVLPNTGLIKIMEEGESELGQLFQVGNTQALTNRVPIFLRDKAVGAVATFQDITRIQEYEKRIRSRLIYKGHIAKYNFTEIIGESEILVKAKEKAKKYAGNDSTVLIIGESGTGKEMFAQSIHLESPRKNGPFVAVNCAAIPDNLLESELFGYEEGAFTGARKSGKQGLFVEAHGGTIFLDEIGEISIEMQTRLLRVLQEREVRPVGSGRVIPVDIRVIAATNKNLLEELGKGNFRSDLYYRLNILKLQVPSLRERKDDINLLSRHFMRSISSKYNKAIEISEDALNNFQHYSWPGNIRELENIIERLVVLNDGMITGEAVKEIICEEMGETCFNCTDYKAGDVDNLEEIKMRHIYKILAECENNQTLAANRLGISRTQLWRILHNQQK